ncbi:hypothetical protein OESDEN_22478 [Oesophagostomum dentatum]|uniref:Uncharacterized protein n=1 Tax=Oesophagostomum dentatum TaxID=61180 RepID=A0A0B1S1Y8_OESDE|nr:hypothetical protein OESDEN_22478 [Oesophagostomum dentatum]
MFMLDQQIVRERETLKSRSCMYGIRVAQQGILL